MSHISIQFSRDFHGIRALLFSVLMLAAAPVLTHGNIPVDEPKPYSKCWTIDTLADLSKSGAADSSGVYFFAADGALEAVDQRNGARVWSTDLGGSVVSNLVLTDSAAIFATAGGQAENAVSARTTLRAVSKQTGITTWSASIDGSATTLGVVGDKLAAVNFEGLISLFALSNGSLLWSQPIGARIVTAPLFSVDHVIVGTDANDLITVDIRTRITTRMLRIGRPPTAVYVDTEGRMLVGDQRGNLVLTSANGDRIWRFKNGAQISFLLPYDQEYLAASFDNFIYKLSRSGGVEWKRRLSGRLSSRPSVIGDEGVISITGDPSVYVLDLTNGKVLNRIDIGGDENLSPRIVAAATNGFAVAGSQGIQFFSRDACSANEKDGTKVPSGSGK